MDYRGRQSRLAEILVARQLDALLVTHLPNVRYLCGFTGSAGVLAIKAGSGGHKAAFFTDGRYKQQAVDELVGTQAVIPKKAAVWAALEWLQPKKTALRVGFEAEHMTVAARQDIGRLAGQQVRLIATQSLVEGLRSIKEADEISQIRKAVELGSSVFEAILPEIKPGVTESSIAAKIEYLSRGLGAEGMSFETIVAAGRRSALPHGVASQNQLPERGFVVLDFGVILGGYCSDMTRTVYLGRPDKEARRIYDTVLEAQLAGIKAVTPGRRCSEVDYAARKVLSRAGLGRYFTHSTGHGVGLEIHEMPGIRKGAKATKPGLRASNGVTSSAGTTFDTLIPGMVVTIEPGVYFPGKFGIRIEDMVAVTEDGCEVLTSTRKDLIVIQ